MFICYPEILSMLTQMALNLSTIQSFHYVPTLTLFYPEELAAP
jgi:hypothetical protein